MKTTITSIVTAILRRPRARTASYAAVAAGIACLTIGTASAAVEQWYAYWLYPNAKSGIIHQTFDKDAGSDTSYWAFWHLGPNGQGVGNTFVPPLSDDWYPEFNTRSIPADGQSVCVWEYNYSNNNAIAVWKMANQGNVLKSTVHGPHAGWYSSIRSDGTNGRTWIEWYRYVYDPVTFNYIGEETRLWLVNADGGIEVEIPYGPFDGWEGYPTSDGNGGIVIKWYGDKKFAHWKFNENGQATGSYYYDIP